MGYRRFMEAPLAVLLLLLVSSIRRTGVTMGDLRTGPDEGRPRVERTRTGEYVGHRPGPSSLLGRYCTRTAC